MTVFKNSIQKCQPLLYQVDLYPLSVLSAALFVSRACLNCDFIIQRNFVDFVTLHKVRGVIFMYNAQCTKDRIKNICKVKKVNMEQMLVECSLGVNAIRQINDTKGMASFSLAKIADYLDCSVDYLLGRTDNPNISGTNIAISNQQKKDTELLDLIKSLPLKKRVKIISMIYDELEEEK